MIIGDNGILTQTERAKELTEQAEEDVQKEMSDLANEMTALTETPPMKILLNSGDDGIVYAPVEYFKGTIDWGDGTKEDFKDKDYNEENYEEPEYHYHTYDNKNAEYVIEISGRADVIATYGKDKILKILDWGELNADGIEFDECYNLTEIASPRENSFKNVTNFYRTFESCTSLINIPSDLFANCPNATNFYSTFAYCTSLTNIPSDLFANCPNVTDFKETFYNCTSLTGSSIRLWEDSNRTEFGITENSGGAGCYHGCINLNDYTTIPSLWKKDMTPN